MPLEKIYLKASKDTDSPATDGTYQKSYSFLNTTKDPIWLIDRDNTPIYFPPSEQYHAYADQGFRIIVRQMFRNHNSMMTTLSAIDSMNHKTKGVGDHRSNIKASLEEAQGRPAIGFRESSQSFFIPYEDIRRKGAVFDKASGFVIAIGGQHLNNLHPESREIESMSRLENHVKDRPNGLLYELIDNEGLLGERFTFMSNAVIRIPVLKNQDKASGLYVYRVTDLGDSVSNVECVPYLFSDNTDKGFLANEKMLGIFRTMEEAETNGNPEIIQKSKLENMNMAHKRELQSMELELKNQSLEHQRILQNMEAERKAMALAHEQTVQRLELDKRQQIEAYEQRAKKRDEEIAVLKEEIERRKVVRADYYESRSADRKDTSEWIKFIPVLILGAAGALAFKR